MSYKYPCIAQESLFFQQEKKKKSQEQYFRLLLLVHLQSLQGGILNAGWYTREKWQPLGNQQHPHPVNVIVWSISWFGINCNWGMEKKKSWSLVFQIHKKVFFFE